MTEFISEQLKLIQTELRETRAELRELSYGQTVLTDMVLRLARDMVQIKELLGRMDSRITRLEHP
jgi:hypothetical protein